MADEVRGRGKLIVAVVVIAAVVGAIAFALGRDDRVSTPVEDAVAGRPLTAGVADPTDSDPGEAGPQGREAPDSQEGRFGAGSPENTRETPALNPGTAPETTTGGSTGRNNPADATARPQSAPTGSLTDGPNADPARSREPGRP